MQISWEYLFVYFFESIGIFMSAFFFLQFYILRRKEYLYYAAYLLLLAIYSFVALPEYYFTLNPNDPEAVYAYDLFKRPVQYLSSTAYTLFVIYYLGLNDIKGKLRIIFRTLLYIYVLAALVSFVLNYFRIAYNPYYFLFSLILLPVQLYVLVSLFRNRIPYSGYIIWGSIITIMGSVSSLLLTIYANGYPLGHPIRQLNIFMPAQFCILIDMFLYAIALQKKIADNEKSLINAAYQRQQAILLERERIIADLHDDVGGGLSSIRMMSDLMVRQQAAPEKQAHFAEKISKTSREIAQRMHTIIWSLNEENDKLDNFIEYVRQFGMSYFENSDVHFSYELLTPDLPAVQINGTLRKNLFLVIKEAFHNILKHAEAGKAVFQLLLDKQTLTIRIIDNGRGIPPEIWDDPHNFGNGLKNMHNRIQEVGGSIRFSSGIGTSIEIIVTIQ
ncbi:MAG TPA: 7TM diverse intracellular signaling domain-containing protein [Ferruginibacter sp.]|nr:7TM diverse intracellular signaling domain-containing protein [Ferruginibacter sp.]